ncbi:hypothetical protein BV25DRAFT_1817613 [Artomyces pyxidatus]|uniref:Uncharacterized protein n=1 Tax=Artomyces pyxidatus TaxID=48021 RepID=A0ACB8TJR5_9AGAM|nr:hypothetical protein BV25DRAFT_1817613 [Artomyces pyxidatus]
MSLRPEREFLKSPSPASSESSMSSSHDHQWHHATHQPHAYQHPAPAYHRPVQSLPPLRAFLRREGLSPDFEPPASQSASCYASESDARAVARADALQRTLRAAAYRQPPAHTSTPYGPAGVLAHKRSLNRPVESSHRSECTDRCCIDSDRHMHTAPAKKLTYGMHIPPLVAPHHASSYSYPALSPYSHPGHPLARYPVSHHTSAIDDQDTRVVKKSVSYQNRASSATNPADKPSASERAPKTSPLKRKLPEDFEDEDDEVHDHDAMHVDRPDTRQSPAMGPPAITENNEGSVNMDPQSHTAAPGKVKAPIRQKKTPSMGRSDAAGGSPPAAASPQSSEDNEGGSSDSEDRSSSEPIEYLTPDGVKLEVKELPVKYDTKEWLKHVERSPDSGKAQWRCTWETMKNGSPMPCDYSSKKHLVKRHIEATHLRIKRFQCTWCGKTFTQRSNVAGCHLNTHTGQSPHGCEFCGEHFKDPSKRHKHMTRHHGYRPSKGKKKFKADPSVQAVSAHESIAPWTVADNGKSPATK